MPRLKTTYEKEIVAKLMSKLSLNNKHDVPKIKKIILNMGLGEDASDGKKLKSCADDMGLIAGQKPIITKFKKSISNFKTRKGSNAGIKVTLNHRKCMSLLIDLLILRYLELKISEVYQLEVLKSYNYSFGIKEHIVFPK